MKTLLATVCPRALDKPLAPLDGDGIPCSVQGFGKAIGADVWEGGVLSDAFAREARDVDAVVLNGNTEMLIAAPDIAAALEGSGTVLCLLQEGDARVWDRAPPDRTLTWMRACAEVDLLLLYNEEHAHEWTALTGTPSRIVRLPFPRDALRYATPWHEREHSIYTGSGCVEGRGGILSLALAKAVDSAAMVYTRLAHYDDQLDRPGCKEIAGALGGFLRPWYRRHDFLGDLARCRLAINLDPMHSYGRFAADCAAVGVPCVGYSGMPAQRELWPNLTLRQDEDACTRSGEWGRLLWDVDAAEDACALAMAKARGQAADRVREGFRGAVGSVLL